VCKCVCEYLWYVYVCVCVCLCVSVCASLNLEAATEVVDAGLCVDVVVDGVALAVPLGGGGGGGGLDRGHRTPHSHIRPVPEGLDGVSCGRR